MKPLVAALTFVLAAFSPLFAADATPVLDVSNKAVEKFSTSDSMLGKRNTLLFYTFKEQKAILSVTINNNDTKFPVTAVVYQFADDVTDESLAKWINNQHSDGLYGDAPEPTANFPVPAEACSVLSHRLIERTKHHNGEHDTYKVKFQIGEFSREGVFKLETFTDEAKLHIKVSE